MNIDMMKLNKLLDGYRERGLTPCALQVANDYWYHCMSKEDRVDIVGGSGYNVHIMERTHQLIDEISIQIINEGVLYVPTCPYRH